MAEPLPMLLPMHAPVSMWKGLPLTAYLQWRDRAFLLGFVKWPVVLVHPPIGPNTVSVGAPVAVAKYPSHGLMRYFCVPPTPSMVRVDSVVGPDCVGIVSTSSASAATTSAATRASSPADRPRFDAMAELDFVCVVESNENEHVCVGPVQDQERGSVYANSK